MGFERAADARQMTADLVERLAKFGLSLHEDKTRLIMFGKFAAKQRARQGMRRPETFDVLGFTHSCATISQMVSGTCLVQTSETIRQVVTGICLTTSSGTIRQVV